MPRLRDDPNFAAAIDAASENAKLAPALIEKDYWVSEVLRELARVHTGRFLFKGGTSLSKAYGLIERFSEDVDLLVIAGESDDAQAVDELLAAICETAKGVTGGGLEVEDQVNGSYVDAVLSYTATKERAPGLSQGVRIEPGIAGGPMPKETRQIRPMLATYFQEVEGYRVADFDDLVPFDIEVLHPARTLIEKLAAINSMAERLSAQPEAQRTLRTREARHFYDVYWLLDDAKSGALTCLESTGLRAIVEDCERVNRRWYSAAKVRPDGGFAASKAFTDASLKPKILKAYNKALQELCYPSAVRPSLEDVFARVLEHQASL